MNEQSLNLDSQKVDETFFTVKLPEQVGLSDQLWHLSKLYTLGIALSYTYVHTPFKCPRSYNVGYFETVIEKSKSILNKFTSINSSSTDKLIEFIGLDKHELNISDQQFELCNIVEINIDEILKDDKINSTSDLKKCIEYFGLYSKEKIYSFVTKGIYKFESKIEQIVRSANLDDSTIKKLKLPEKYWKAKEKFSGKFSIDNSKVKITLHIRKGDRTCINLNGKLVSVFASSIKVIDSTDYRDELKQSLMDTTKAYNLIQEIFNKYGEEYFSVQVLSDGYQRTFFTIIWAMVRGKIKLNLNDLKQLHKTKKALSKEFNDFLRFSNISLVVGESKQNLFQSIHAIVCADILIITSGGFAYWVHNFFRKSNQPSLIINLNSCDNKVVNKISKFL
ncbi:MAG: hypothetical protein RID53_02285 [Coleofasciculus sp. B1-GNL1-01]|uniref:hypothetical protein n=1 Tax=Coleofasciculus sp. B1-GNL1-01 TaxID=3068484 RepID=UPI0032FE5475